jgi:hypothetical protein
MLVKDNSGPGYSLVTSSQNLNDNNWYHLVGTYLASTTTISLYVDGVLSNNGVASGTVVTLATNDSAGIGHAIGFSEYYNGSLDDARIYNRALSAQEVAQLYAVGK